ncbi:MAG: hypothetical protein GY928_27815 [Colwellia sp.]|nr:hypothetical protein [Colwellia sp.]
MESEDHKIERRIDMAIAIARMADEIKALTKKTDFCEKDRVALFKRIRQTDLQISKLEIKQGGIFRGIYILAVGTVALLGKFIYDFFHH